VFSAAVPELYGLADALDGHSAVLDGELVAGSTP
jgi:ATP-dependent DNA ligase